MGFIVVQDPQTFKPYRVQIAGDTPSESEKQEIQQFIEQQRNVVPTVEPTDDKSGTALGRGASVGIDVLQQMYGSALEGVGKVTGIEGLRDYGASVVETNQEQIEEKQKAFTQRQDVGSVGDAFSFYGETLGQNLPQLGTSIGAGLATQALLPFAPGVGFLVGALASNIPFFYGSHRERQKEAIEQGKRTELDEGTAFMYSLPSAALDTVVDKFLVGLKPLGLGIKKSAISPSVGGFFTKVVDKSMVGSVAARATMGATAGAATEIPTEIGQQLIERYQAGLPIDDDEAIKEYIDVAIAAGLVGGTVRGTTNALTGKGKAALANEELDKDIQAEGLQAKEMAETQKKNLDRGLGEPDPLQIGVEEDKLTTQPLNPTQEKIATTKAATESQTPFREIIIKDELTDSEQNILLQQRQAKGITLENPNTTIGELEALVEPSVPNITEKYKKLLKPNLSTLPSHSLNFVQNHSESQYNAVSDFLKNKETGTSIEKDTIIDKIKDILVKAKQTDENNVVTDETARSISDKLVKDGKITNIRDFKTDTSSFTINRDTFEDAQENALKRARQRLENTRQNYEKTELNIRRVEQDMPMLGKKNVFKNTAKFKSKDRKINQLKKENARNVDAIEKLSKTVDSLVDARTRQQRGISPPPNTVEQVNTDQMDANQSRVTIEQAAVDEFKQKELYKAKREGVLNSLKKYIGGLGLSDVALVAENTIGGQGKDLSQKDYVVEGEFSEKDSKRVIAIAMELYDPNLTPQQYERKLKAVLNHEVIHAVKSLGLFENSEYRILVKAATERNYVFKDGKKLLKRNYTYLDRAKRLYPDLDQSGQEEEAIAELFRDAMDGKIKLAGKPRTLLQRFKDFFKSIFKAHSDNGFRSVDEIFDGIRTGKVGKRDRSTEREYLNTKESPVAQKNVSEKTGKQASLRDLIDGNTSILTMSDAEWKTYNPSDPKATNKLSDLGIDHKAYNSSDEITYRSLSVIRNLSPEKLKKLAAFKNFKMPNVEEKTKQSRIVFQDTPDWFKETPVNMDIKPEDAQKTQITTTTSTYEKAFSILPEGKTLDYGAGKGLSSTIAEVDTYEPFPDETFNPDFSDTSDIPSNSYDNVVNLNVLNVVTPNVRDGIVSEIGRVMKVGGRGIITTRGRDIFGSKVSPVKGMLGKEPMSVITSRGTYQKGFKQTELRDYVQNILGDSFTVTPLELGAAGVEIVKNSDVETIDAVTPKKEARAIRDDIVPDTPTLFDIAPQEDMEKLSNVMDSMEKQVVTPRVKYSRRAVKPADPEIMREIPIDFTKSPDTYKRQLSESMLRYAYGYVRETNGNVIPITFKEGDNVVLEDGREGGYGAWHITSRGHDIELREATKQEPDRVIYTMLRKMVEQEYGNGQPGTIVIEPSTRGNDFDITWANNRPKKYPPIKLSLMYQAPTETRRAMYTVRTAFPQEAAKRSIKRFSAVPTGTQPTFGDITTEAGNDITYTDSLQFIEKIIRGGTLGFASKQKSRELAESFVKKFQDSMIPVGIMLDELRAKGLTIKEAFDPYMKEVNSHGIAGNLIKNNKEQRFDPLNIGIDGLDVTDTDISNVIAVSKRDNPTRTSFLDEQIKAGKNKKMAFFESYLYAKHAQERNTYVLEKTGSEKSKIDPIENGSGMTNQESQAILNWFEGYRNIRNVRQLDSQVRGIVDNTNNVRQEGQLSPIFDTEVEKPFDNYVPLRGSLDEGDETTEIVNRKPRQTKGREDPRITGRSKYATDIVGNLISQNMSAIRRAEHNKIGLSMLKLIEEGGVPVQEYAEVMEVTPVVRAVDGRTGVISSRPQTPQEIANDPSVLIVKRFDPEKSTEANKVVEEVAIQFTDPRIAKALRGDGVFSPTNSAGVVRGAARINRFLASVNTSYNPAFIIPNFSRDLITASINIAQYDVPNVQRDLIKNVPSAMRGIKRAVFNNDKTSEDARMYLEFVEAGGQNILNQVTTLADQVSDIRNTVGNISKNPVINSFKKLGSFLENTNVVAENAMRVATYKTLRQKGFSKERAAQAARNVTVNFAKTGEIGRFINSFYLFYNASIQGTFAALQAATRSKKVRTMWAGLIAYGLMQDQLMSAFSDEDEDGNLVYDKIPDYVLEHNLILPDLLEITDRSVISIPFPYGFNMAMNTGRSLSRWSRGGYTAGQAANSMEGTLYEIINPFGGTESFLNFVMPTVADPFISIAQNYDYAGRPIFKEPSQFGIGKPDSQLYWNSTTNLSKGITEFLNEITGGSKGVSGVIDVNPAIMDFWIEYTVGGLGRFVNNVGDLAVGAVVGDPDGLLQKGFTEDNVRRLPVARKFVYSVSEREDVGAFVKKRDRVLTALNELKRTAKQGDREGYKKAQNKFKDELSIAGQIKSLDNARNRLMRQRNQVQQNEKMDKDRKQKLIERYNEGIQDIVARANMVMRDIEVSFLEDLLN